MDFAACKPSRHSHSHQLILAFFLACTASAPAAATGDPSGDPPAIDLHPATDPQGWGIRLGYNSDYQKITLVRETPLLWRYRLGGGWGRLDLNAELSIAYWTAQHGHPDSMWQLGATPMLRWWPNKTFYVEAGIGATVLNRTHFAGRRLSTAFQFGDHLGMGVLVNRSSRIGFRYSHFSNADIKKPNPGLDMIQFSYTYQF